MRTNELYCKNYLILLEHHIKHRMKKPIKCVELEHIIQLGDMAGFFCSFSLLRPGPDNTNHQNFLRSCKLKPAQSENSTTALLGAKRNLKVWTYNLENFDWLKSLKTI